MNILDEIIIHRKKDLEEMKIRLPISRLRSAAENLGTQNRRSFRKAISNSKRINLICELKKASPSEGLIREDFQPLRIASHFDHAGAAAISILTEPRYFKGRPSYLKTVRQVTPLPLLRKDFIFESYQLYETRLLEADAFLLIASILTGPELAALIRLGEELGMDALVEIHHEEDLKKALHAGAKIIGINNRDLRTFETDPFRAERLLPHLAKDSIPVIESGIRTHEEIMHYKSLGAHSFLIGTALMRSENIIATIESLLGPEYASRSRKAHG